MKRLLLKRLLSMVLLCLLACSPALAAQREPQYSLKTKGLTVLQGEPGRSITPSGEALAPNPLLPGESPVTGLPLAQGEAYFPMLVQIDNSAFSVTWEKRKTTGGGLGKRAPWGLQWADIVYESILYRTGYTRMTALFSDSLAQGQPASVGPVRSARLATTLLQTEWQGGVVYASGPAHQEAELGKLLEAQGLPLPGKLLNLFKSPSYRNFANRVQGTKAPSNLNVDLVALRDFVAAPDAAAHPFLFAAQSPYQSGYAPAAALYLDWGHKDCLSHFVYDPATGLYQRFSGNAPYRSFLSAENREESAMEPLCFANVIVQRVSYEYPGGNLLDPRMQAIGQGNADIFIGGRYIPGFWVRNSLAEPTVFLDGQGNELLLQRGRTFIACFPEEALLGYEGGAQAGVFFIFPPPACNQPAYAL